MIKCYACWKPGHKFSDCLSETCTCSCVREIYLMPSNQQEDTVAIGNPKFLKIDNVEIKNLPDLAKEVTEFNKINKEEWVPGKRDRRFKRKRYEDYNP